MKTFKIIILCGLFIFIQNGVLYSKSIGFNKAPYIFEDQFPQFYGIDISGRFDVYINYGPLTSVKIDKPNNLPGNIITEVKNGVLKIYAKSDNPNLSWGNQKVNIYITAKDINSIRLSGPGKVVISRKTKTDSLNISLVGSGSIEGEIDVEKLKSKVKGSGNIKIEGKAKNSIISVSGSGAFLAENLITSFTTANVSGSGNAYIYAKEKITASLSGSGSIKYSGSPKKVVKLKKSQSGRINSL